MTEDGNGDVIIQAAETGCTIPAGTYNITRDFVIESGVSVTATGNTGGGTGVIINAGRDIDIQGTLSANAQGYQGRSGPGAGSGTGYGSSGAAHGGNGGEGRHYGTAGGTAYGSVSAPVTLGSGGGGSLTGGEGGGAIKLVATNTLTIDGSVTANGDSYANSFNDGGGAGGSIWLDTASLAGTGTITANGGQGGFSRAGGGGGGGRIAVYYTTDTSSIISGIATKIRAYGRDGGGEEGGAGTIFVDDKDDSNTNGSLYVDGNNYTDVADTPQIGASETYDYVDFRNGTDYVVSAGSTLTIPSTGTLTGSGTEKASIELESGSPGGILNLPSTGTYTLNGMNIINDGQINNVSDLTVANAQLSHNGAFGTTVTSLTLDSGGEFVAQTATGLSLSSLTAKSGGYFTQQTGSTLAVTDVEVQSGGYIRSGDNSTAQSYTLDISATDIDIQSGGFADANGRGYDPRNGPGAGAGTGYGSSGAAHGGNGGEGRHYGTAGGTAYGNVTAPTTIGSGGGGGSVGGNGGGAIKLVASGTLTVDGTVRANGDSYSSGFNDGGGAGGGIWLDAATLAGAGTITANGGQGGAARACGGGGGGRIAVYYTTDTSSIISGIATKIRAYGRDGGGEEGGAGTIFVDDKDDSNTNGSLYVDGNNYTDVADTPQIGASETYDYVDFRNGTDYVVSAGSTLTIPSTGTLTGSGTEKASIELESGSPGGILNLPSTGTYTLNGMNVINGGQVNNVSNLTVANAQFTHNGDFGTTLTSLTLDSGGEFRPQTATGMNLSTLTAKSGGYFTQMMTGAISATTVTVESGGYIRSGDNSTTKAYELSLSSENIDIQSGGFADANGRGYDPRNGPGAGAGTGYGSSGAAHGGNGGEGRHYGTAGGVGYGNPKQPSTMGSGAGGGSAGGNGGGAIKLVASDTLTINGTVRSNGDDYSSAFNDGGGAGGGIWLDADTLAGDGTITANGGVGGSARACGGGGGGRIAIYYATDTSSIISGIATKVRAYGRNGGGEEGGGGSIFIDDTDDSITNGRLYLDGGGYTDVADTPSVDDYTFTHLVLRNGIDLVIASSDTWSLDSGGSITDGGGIASVIVVNDGGRLDLPTAGINGVDLTNNGTVGAATTSMANEDAIWTNNATVAGVTEFNCTSGTCENSGTFEGGLTNLTIGNGGNFVQTSTEQLFSGSDLIIESGGTFTQNHTETITVGTLRVETGGTLTHADNTTSKLAEIDFSVTTLEVQAGAFINVDGLGFNASEGDGAGGDAAAGGGAGYAVAGGEGYVGGAGQGNGGSSYGSESAPTDMGSGGGNDTDGGAGGAGGGVVKIIVSGTATINGDITANGGTATTNQAGGGSGGSIWLEANTWAGTTGTISADGGAGAGNDTDGGGCGAGGRVRFFYGTKTYTGSAITADNGCTGVRAPSGTPTISEEANAPTFTEFSITPAVPGVTDSVLVESIATFGSGIDKIEIYLDGTDPGDLVHTCDPAGTSDPLSCDYPLGPLSRGSHTVTAKAYGPAAQEGTAADTFTVAAETTANSISLSSLKAGDTAVDFALEFTLAGESTGTLSVDLTGFTVTDSSGTGSSACLSNFDSPTGEDITADKTACSGTVTLTGIQLTNPGSAGSYTITWSNDNGSATVFIVDDDAVSVTGNIDPTLTFDLDVSVIDADSDDPYAVDLGTLSTSGPSGSNNGTIPSIWIDLSTNATGGATVTVSSLYQALRSVSNPSDEIASATATLAGGTEGYGICVASATGNYAPGDSFTAQGNYAGTCTAGSYDVGALPADSSPLNLLIASGPISAGRSQVRVGASMSTATPAHPDYTDTLTFLATGTF
jgi:hypothetical protein